MRLRKQLAVAWVALVMIAAGFVGTQFIRSNPIETDILALLPATERNPRAEEAVKILTSRLGNRVVFLLAHGDADTARDAARAFADDLRKSGAFSSVTDSIPPLDPMMLASAFQPYSAGLLSGGDRELLDRPDFDIDAILLRQLHQPVRTGMLTPLSEDPFGFLQRWLSGLPFVDSRMAVEENMMVFRDQGAANVLVLAEPAGSAFESALQERTVNAVAKAEESLKSFDGVTLLRTGAVFYAEAARRSAESDVDIIAGGSLIGIVLLLWLTFRSVRPLTLGLVTVAIGVLAGITAVLFFDEKLHIITLVFGASLIGEAIDYSIQYFAAHIDAGPDWEPSAGLRRVLPALAMALSTSLLGYAALSLTPFPAISQIAVFSMAGLAAAWISVLLILPFFLRRPCAKDMEATMRHPRRILAAWRDRVSPTRALLLFFIVAAIAAPGWLRLTANDDIRQLISRPPQLVEQENMIRRIVAGDNSTRFFLVEGPSDEEALQREEALAIRLRSLAGSEMDGFTAISEFVPSQAVQRDNRQTLAKALPPDKVAALLEEHGFRDESVRSWRDAMDPQAQFLDLDAWIGSPVSVPLRHQVLARDAEGTSLIVTLRGDKGGTSLAATADGLPGVTFVDKTHSVASLFARYRELATIWLPIAVAIVAAVLVSRYGKRRGIATLAPAILAMSAALGVYGYLGVPLTLFTMMGLALVLGVGVNYAIFLVEAGDEAPALFAGVLLSAATTLLSFGLLSMSGTPALRQFGLVLLVGISLAVLLAPVALTLGKGQA